MYHYNTTLGVRVYLSEHTWTCGFHPIFSLFLCVSIYFSQPTVAMETSPTFSQFAESGNGGCSLAWLVLLESLGGISGPSTQWHVATCTSLGLSGCIRLFRTTK